MRSVLIVLVFTCSVAFGQARSSQQTQYYLFIYRPGCCELTQAKWESIARTLRARKVPVFFGRYSIHDYRSPWYPSTIQRTVAEEGGLAVGPFSSAIAAEAVLHKLPRVLPRIDGENHTAVRPGPTASPQQWQIGMYQIWGVSSKAALVAVPSKLNAAGTIEGTVLRREEGAKWYGIIMLGDDGVKYLVQTSHLLGAHQVRGDVERTGNRVRITFKDKDSPDVDGTIYLHATSVSQIRE